MSLVPRALSPPDDHSPGENSPTGADRNWLPSFAGAWAGLIFPLLSLSALLGVALFLFSYEGGIATEQDLLGPQLWMVWTTEDCSYCLLVPFIILYLVFRCREELAAAPRQASNAGLGWTLLGLLVFWIGVRSGRELVGCAGLQIILAGAIIWFWGKSIFRLLLFPWALIWFLWPATYLDSTVAFPLRIMVTKISYFLLNLIGVGCLRNGTALYSAPDPLTGVPAGANFQIDIADPCSGIHSLVALLMFSALYSYLVLPRRWQQWTVFLSAIPIAVAGNVVRILLLVAACLLWGNRFAIGTDASPSWFHEAGGFAVFAVVAVLEYLLGLGLVAGERRYSGFDESPAEEPALDAAEPVPAASIPPAALPAWRGAVFLGLALVLFTINEVTPPLQVSPEAGVVMQLPDQLQVDGVSGGDFHGRPAPVSETEHRMLPPDTQFCRKNYTDSQGHDVYFSIVLSSLQFTIHRPEVCLLGQGWTIPSYQDIPIDLSSGRQLMVRNLSLQRQVTASNGQSRTLDAYYMYWYVDKDESTCSYHQRTWMTVRNRIFYNLDRRWAYVTAMAIIGDELRPDGLNSDQTILMLKNFIRKMLPYFQKSEMPGAVAGT